jgi:cellulose synthase/poly-beta-1,6-N-acetylglucosamine synthase-like glycosyltransferase
MEEYPAVSIVVAAYNAQETIGDCIQSLLSVDYPNKEIIIVNDGSKDDTEKIARRYPVKLISQPNMGASSARNTGLREAKYGIVAYTDSDCKVAKDWLKKLVKHFSDPKVGAVTGKTIFETNETCTSYVRSLDIEERNQKRGRYTRLANGPNSAFRREVLRMVGGFNPKWFHAEDTEVSYEIWKADYRIEYEPEAIVFHSPESNWKNFLRKRFRDAKAFTRMLYFYPMQASVKDDFVTTSMKLQPPLFLAITILAVIALIGSFISLPTKLIYLWALLLVVGLAINMPFSIKVWKKSSKASFLPKALLLTTARGFCWAAGLIVGALEQQPYILDREI